MRIAAIAAAVVMALVALYVMLSGPVFWLIAHGYLPAGIAHIYDPVWTLPVISDFIEWEIRQMP